MGKRFIYSNRAEELYRAFREDFAWPCKVVVPSQAVKEWLQNQLAHDMGVAAGIEFLFLEEVISRVIEFPSELELTLRILSNEEVGKVCHGKPQRILGVARSLAETFRDYAVYGKPELEGWEEELFSSFPLEYRPFEKPVHLFGFSYLPPKLLELLKEAKLYLFSPCQMYWEDVCSDRERINLQQFFKKKGISEEGLEELDLYLRDANPLLANWGRLGRRFVYEGEERYVAPSGETLLENVQRDVLMLEEGEYPVDASIQVHAAPNRLREVEELFRQIAHAKVYAHEIVVMAPDIQPYVPFIKAVFGGKIPFRIADVEGNTPPALELLLNLADGRWGANELVELFDLCGLDVKHWVLQAGVRWGRDADHQQELVKPHGELIDQRGAVSWKRGLERLLDQLTITGEIPFSAADELDHLFAMVDMLKRDVATLKKRRTPKEWHELLSILSEKYFGEVCEELTPLGRVNLTESFSLQTIRHLLFRKKRKSTLHKSHIDGVRFSSLQPLPAKIICLLGMDEEGFPRRHVKRPFDRLLAPSLAEADRYRFLETLLSAREKLLIFYSHTNPDDGKVQEPCPLVSELMSYTGIKTCTHPHLPYHHSYTPLSQEEYNRACAFYHPTPPNVSILKLPNLLDDITVDVRDLSVTARDPARFYLQANGIRFEEEELLLDHESFTLDALEAHQLSWASISGSLNEDQLPGGAFLPVARERVERRAEEIRENLASHNLTAEDLTTFELPPSEISYDGRIIRLVGEISGSTPEGLFVHGRRELANLIKAWPALLAYQIHHPNAPLLFSRHQKPLVISVDPKEQLKRYLAYHFSCKENLVPLAPEWIASFLKKGVVEKPPLFMSPYLQWALSGFPPDLHQWEKLLHDAFGPLMEAWK